MSTLFMSSRLLRLRFGLWTVYVGALLVLSGLAIAWRPLASLDATAELALGVLAAATLAAEVFTVDFPDRKRISGSYIFPLLASAVISPTAGVLVAGTAGVASGLLHGQRWRPALFHGPQLALSAAAGTAAVEAVFGEIPLQPTVAGALAVLLYMAVYTTLAWLLGRVEETIAEKPAEQASVDLLTNLLLVPLPLALAVVYERTSVNGLLLSALALALLLIVVRAYVNLATLHGELKQAYARLADQEQRLEHALEANRDMAQVVSHDLRGPLTSVMGYTELLRSGLHEREPEQLQRYINSIEGNSRRILGLADKLLDLNRLEEGGEVELTDVDPAAILRQVADGAQVQADQKHIAVDREIAPNVPVVRTSEWMLREIAENLTSNAIKYTRESGHVVLRLDHNNGQLVLEVEDNGIGMGPEDRARLFTKFFRSGSEEVRSVRGTGLGLALTKTMIERLGGRIDVWSELNQGSRFTVHLPLSPAAA